MTATPTRTDVRGFYQALGIELPGWAHTEAPVRCFADPDAHQHQDRDASCSVNLASGAFNCHGCGAHGGGYDAALAKGHSSREAIDLMIVHGLAERRPRPHGRRNPSPVRANRRSPAATAQTRTRSDAIRRVPRVAHDGEREPVFAVTREQVVGWARSLGENPELIERLAAERGWDQRTLSELEVGFDGERITVPIPAEHDTVCGLLRLRIDVAQRPKVLAASGTRLGLIPRPVPGQEDVWLVEGPSDMLAARSAGLPAIAVPGTHAWRTEWAEAFSGRRVTVVMDADRPGRHAAVRIASDLEQHVAAHVRILELAPERDDGYDLSDWLRECNHPRTLTAHTYTSDQYRRILEQADRTVATARGANAARGSSSRTVPTAAIERAGTRSYGCARF
jgi:hypothetical protein